MRSARGLAAGITAEVGLSAVLASPQIAAAGVVAFTTSEIVDALSYTRLRYRTRLGAVAAVDGSALRVSESGFVVHEPEAGLELVATGRLGFSRFG